MLNLRHIFYTFGVFSVALIVSFNISLSSYPNKHIDSPQNQDYRPQFLSPKTYDKNIEEENLNIKKKTQWSTPEIETLSENDYYKALKDREVDNKSRAKKVVPSSPKKRSVNSNNRSKTKSDERTMDDIIKKMDKDDPLLKRLKYTLESQQKVNNNDRTHPKQEKKDQKTLPVANSILKQKGVFKNLFQLLGAYPEVPEQYFNTRPNQTSRYERINYGLYNDEDYCQLADLYNLEHPENMLKRMTFFTDYDKDGLSRKDVLRKIGHDLSPRVSITEYSNSYKSRKIHIEPRTTTFYTHQSNFHYYHKIGRHFLCATQMYNHIPGHGALIRKDLVADNINAYALRYKDKGFCLTKNEFFPSTFRLYSTSLSLMISLIYLLEVKEECNEFFKILNSEQYTKALQQDPVQYVMKSPDRYRHSTLLDSYETSLIKETYDDGNQCGVKKTLIMAQSYIANPLLLNFQNKFNIRIYILITSTNPLIVFYTDGFIRASLFPFDKNHADRSVHLTNTHLSKDIFAEVSTLSRSLHGMTAEEIRNYQIWTFERLENYLLEADLLEQPGWVDNYLRPKLKEVAVHLVRMSASSFWSQSNVFELFALDFLVDDQLKLWFMECNPVTGLFGQSEYHTSYLINMLKDMFEIQYAYYRSRMKRIMALLNKMEAEYIRMGSVNYRKYKERYTEIVKNSLEPEYEVSKNNSFEIIIDENLKGTSSYFGILKEGCVDD